MRLYTLRQLMYNVRTQGISYNSIMTKDGKSDVI